MKKIIVAVVIVGVLGGVGVWWWKRDSAPVDAYRTAPAKMGEVVQTISATGPVEPEEVVDIGAQVAGIIDKFGTDPVDHTKLVDYRTSVKQGMLLAHIDDTTYAADRDSAKAAVDQANATVDRSAADLQQMKAKLVEASRDWERAQKIGPSDALSENDYDMYQANYEEAKANVAVDEATLKQSQAAVVAAQGDYEKAKRNFDFCTINSPVDGVVIDRRVNVGQTVVSSLSAPSLFLIAKDLRRMQVWASVNEADVGSIYPGQKVTFTVSAFPNRTFTGAVGKLRYNAAVTSNVVIYTVEIQVDNADLTLIPYLTANAQFIIGDHDNVLTVPDAALHWNPQMTQVSPEVRKSMAENESKNEEEPSGSKSQSATTQSAHHRTRGTVWVKDGEFVKPIQVRVGISDGANTEITAKDSADLPVGTQVIVGDAVADSGAGGANPFVPAVGPRTGTATQHARRRWRRGRGWSMIAEAPSHPPIARAAESLESRLATPGLIRLRDVTKTYYLGEMDVPVLKGVSVAIDKGELVALTGASGSGKSTLMNILGCLDRPTTGNYLLDNQEVGTLSKDGRAHVRNKKIGFVFQNFNLLSRTSALDNVLMPLMYTASHLPDSVAMQQGVDMLKLVGLSDRLDHFPSQLSGGQQQRVAIARALVNKPPLILADEPTGNLDSRTSEEILAMFQKLNTDEGITIILVTHSQEVAQHAKRQIVMRDGLIESGLFT